MTDDLIRKSDALAIAHNMNNGETAKAIHRAIAALPAVTAPQGVDAGDELVSEQRIKYEKLCARVSAGKASQQEAVDAIMQLCRDNERLAVLAGKARAALAPAQPAPDAPALTPTPVDDSQTADPAANAPDHAAIREASPNRAYRVGYAAGRAAALREAAQCAINNQDCSPWEISDAIIALIAKGDADDSA